MVELWQPHYAPALPSPASGGGEVVSVRLLEPPEDVLLAGLELRAHDGSVHSDLLGTHVVSPAAAMLVP